MKYEELKSRFDALDGEVQKYIRDYPEEKDIADLWGQVHSSFGNYTSRKFPELQVTTGAAPREQQPIETLREHPDTPTGAGGGYDAPILATKTAKEEWPITPEKDSIGTPLNKTFNMIAQLPGQVIKMTPAVIALLARQGLTGQPGNTMPSNPRERSASAYNAVKPTTDRISGNYSKWVDEYVPYDKPTGKYAKPAKSLLPKDFNAPIFINTPNGPIDVSPAVKALATDNLTDPKRAYKTIVENSGTMTVFAAASFANPVFGFALMASAEGAETANTIDEYQAMTGKQVDPDLRAVLEMSTATVNGLLEKVGLDTIIKTGRVPGLSKKISQAIVAHLTEGTQEGLQEVTQILAESGYNNEARKWSEQIPRISESFYGGLIAAIPATSIAGIAGHLSEKQGKNQGKTGDGGTTIPPESGATVQPEPEPAAQPEAEPQKQEVSIDNLQKESIPTSQLPARTSKSALPKAERKQAQAGARMLDEFQQEDATTQKSLQQRITAALAQAKQKRERLPQWAREEMINRGLDPNRPLNDVDVANLKDVIKSDPSLSEEEKKNIIETGSPKKKIADVPREQTVTAPVEKPEPKHTPQPKPMPTKITGDVKLDARIRKAVGKKAEPKPEPKVIDEDTFLAINGAGRNEMGESALHKNIQEGKAKRDMLKRQSKKDWEIIEKRDKLRKEYKDKVASGEIRPPTRLENLHETANGNEDNEAVQAARRLLEKKGIDWKKPLEQQPPTPTPEPAAKPEREPWEMTRGEYLKIATSLKRNPVIEKQFREDYPVELTEKTADKIYHEYEIKQALASGKPVPPEVLADYPDLMPKAEAEVIEPDYVQAGNRYWEHFKKNPKYKGYSDETLLSEAEKFENPDKDVESHGKTYKDTILKSRKWQKENQSYYDRLAKQEEELKQQPAPEPAEQPAKPEVKEPDQGEPKEPEKMTQEDYDYYVMKPFRDKVESINEQLKKLDRTPRSKNVNIRIKRIHQESDLKDRLAELEKNRPISQYKIMMSALQENKTVNAVALDKWGITKYEGYVREGDLYVYNPEKAKQQTEQPIEEKKEPENEPIRTINIPGRGIIEVKGTGAATYWRDPSAGMRSPFGSNFVLASPEFRDEIEKASGDELQQAIDTYNAANEKYRKSHYDEKARENYRNAKNDLQDKVNSEIRKRLPEDAGFDAGRIQNFYDSLNREEIDRIIERTVEEATAEYDAEKEKIERTTKAFADRKDEYLKAATVKDRQTIFNGVHDISDNKKNIGWFGEFPIQTFKNKFDTKQKPADVLFKNNIVSDDANRPALTGVFHSENGDLVATDGHAMVVIHNKSDKSGKVKLDDGLEAAGDLRYPNHEVVMPKKPETLGVVDVEEMLNIGKSADKLRTKDDYPMVRIGEQRYNSNYVKRIASVLYELGIKKANVLQGEKGNFGPGPILFKDAKGKVTALLMPINGNVDKVNYTVTITGAPKQSTSSPGSEAEMGGYADRNNYYDNGPYQPTERPSVIKMPEIVRMAAELMKGKYPKIMEKMGALGYFKHPSGNIALRSDIFKGELLKTYFSNQPADKSKVQGEMATKSNLPADRIYVSNTWDKSKKGWVVKVYRLDPSLAGKVLAHEIGHLVDWLPDNDLSRGNILGRIASLKRYLKGLLEEYEGAPEGILTEEDKKRLRQEARAMLAGVTEKEIDVEIKKELPITPADILAIWNEFSARERDPELYRFIAGLNTMQKKQIVIDALKGKVSDWINFKRFVVEHVKQRVEVTKDARADDINAKWKEMIRDEIKKRRLFSKTEIMQELKNLTQIWKPFDEKADPEFTKYRYSSRELYADAISVLVNEPSLLENTAPEFYRGFFNYLHKKPEVKTVWESLQALIRRGDDAVFAERHKGVVESFLEGEKKRKELLGKTDDNSFLFEIKKGLLDKNQALIDKVNEVKKSGRFVEPDRNPMYWVEELPYLQSQVFQYMRDIDNDVKKPLEKAGVTLEDFGYYLMLRRSATERKYFANPFGYNEAESKKDMAILLTKLGPAKKAALLDAVDTFERTRTAQVTTFLKESGMLSKELEQYIDDHKEYVTFSVQEYIDDKHGKGIAAKIHRQIGTLKGVENPLYTTALKDASLMRSAMRTIAARKAAEFMRAEFPEEVQEIPRGDGGKLMHDAPPEGMEALLYLEQGKITGVFVPKGVAQIFENRFHEFPAVAKWFNAVAKPFKEIFVGKNIPWSLWNVQRDFRGALSKLPDKLTFRTFLKSYIQSIPDAYKDVFKNESTAIVKKMYQERALIVGRNWTATVDHEETVLDAMMKHYGIKEDKHSNPAVHFLKSAWDALEKPGKFTERLPKIAAFRIMERKGVPTRQLTSLTRTRAGSPDFYRRGVWYPITNSVFMFSNAGKEGWRSSAEAAKDSPMAFMWKIFAYDVAPKMTMRLAEAGVLTAAAMAAFGPDDDRTKWAKWMQELFKKIPNHDKQNYMTVPIGETKSGKATYLVFPHDFTGQVIGGIAWNMSKGFVDGNMTELFDFVQGGIPYSSLAPPVSMMIDAVQFASGKNPYDSWAGRTMISESKWKAGGKTRNIEFAKQEWSRYGGTYLYRFPYDNLDKIQTDVEKMLSAPLTGQITRRFIRTSDRGLYEDLVKPMEKVREKRTTAGLDVNERIAEHLNKGNTPSREDAKALYNDLKKQGVDVRTFGGFYTRYQTKAAYRKNDAISLALSKAQSNEEKAAALSKFLGKKIDEKQVKDAIKYLDLKNKKDRTKVEQVIFTSLKGRLGL